jgi:hypothetical protein
MPSNKVIQKADWGKYSVLLTIAIPTFNRPTALKERIIQLSNLHPKLATKIEILICDNGNIELAVPNEIGSLKVNYIRNLSNVGLGRNIENCVFKANGTFTWILSDDDFVFVDNIEKLVNHLEQTKAQVIALGEKNQELPQTNHSPKRSEVPIFWKDFIFISGCIYNSKSAQGFISHRLNSDINPTYHQVLISLGMFLDGSTLECIENIYVQDTYTEKNYNLRSSYIVRIHDLVRLESQLRVLGMLSADMREIEELTNSHIINYIPRIVFEFSRRQDFLLLSNLIINSFRFSGVKIKRILLLGFSLLLVTLAIIHFKLARASLYLLSFLLRKKLIPVELGGFARKGNTDGSKEASTLGYEGN